MLEFRWTPESAAHCKSRSLAATWANWGFYHEGRPIFELVDTSSLGLRDRLYGSLLPVAQWAIVNWWFLICEGAPAKLWTRYGEPVLENTGERLRKQGHNDWLLRHSLRAAGHGFAYPDLVAARDGDQIVLRWLPDPPTDDARRPVRFVGVGSASIPVERFEAVLDAVIRAALLRADGVDDSWISDLRAGYEQLQQQQVRGVTRICALAALGLDASDPEDLTEDQLERLAASLDALPDGVCHDLTRASSSQQIESDLAWVQASLDRLGGPDDGGAQAPMPAIGNAALEGHRVAQEARAAVAAGDAPLLDLPKTLAQKFDLDVRSEVVEVPEGTSLEGFVARAGGKPIIVGRSQASVTSERFRMARALFFWRHVGALSSPRLLSGSKDWYQRASRAFAAEFLAPAEVVLQAKNADDVSELAARFNVSERVIQHQLENYS